MTERERLFVRKKLVELLDQNHGYVREQKAEELADYLLENGVIVPPVEVGDKVWIIMANYTIAEGCVVFTENKSDTEFDYFQFCVSYYPTCHWRNEITTFITNDIGKTVFLTKEETEKALKGGNND